MKILYVDNHEVFANIATEQFLEGFEVEIVATVAEARRKFAAGGYDVVLVDYDLDDGKGDELVRHIRGKAKIIAVSSHEAGNRALMAAGANASCAKAQFKNLRALIA